MLTVECDEGVRTASAIARGDVSSVGGEQRPTSDGERPLGMPALRVPPQGRPRGEGSSIGVRVLANGDGEPIDGRVAQP